MLVAVITVVLVILVAGIALAAVASRGRGEGVPVTAGGRGTADELAVFDSGTTGAVEVIAPVTVAAPTPAAPVPALFDLEHEPAAVAAAPEIRWCLRFDPRSGALDDIARLRLIGDLGVVATEWCVPLLAQAYEEEPRPGNRQAALIALAACRSKAAIATFRLALATGEAQERAIAADALADLEPVSPAKSKTFVERW